LTIECSALGSAELKEEIEEADQSKFDVFLTKLKISLLEHERCQLCGIYVIFIRTSKLDIKAFGCS